MLKLADVKSSDVVYDLGCGDGRIVIMAAQKFGAQATGVDIDPERIREARENARKAGMTSRVKFIQQDLFEADIRPASVVTLYLLPGVNLKLRPKLLKDLKPGSRVVSNSFDMGDWKPDKEIDHNGRKLYLWIVPANGAIKTQ
jgi:ribosomal protein L11 methylase PrmA